VAKIFVIDDDPAYRTLVVRALERMSHQVETAVGGAKALRCLAEGGFELIVTDIFMPDMDGLAFIGKAAELTKAPILAISGGGTQISTDFLKHARTLGAAAVLHKPFSSVELGNIVTGLLAGGGMAPPEMFA
jgi:CheY-like chemotaxis protein